MLNKIITGVGLALAVAASPANAVTNLIKNGSFENGFTGFSHVNAGSLAAPSVVLEYGQANSYPVGAYGEAIPADNSISASPDAVGTHAAYFVDDQAMNEAVTQLTYLSVGNYEIGFSAYLPGNGFANQGEAAFSATIIGTPVTSFLVSTGTKQNWVNFNGVAQITLAGHYLTSFNFNTFGGTSKDVVIDRVYAVATDRPATVLIPPTPAYVPEPATWGLMLTGFVLTGFAMRRRKIVFTA